ncbi:hypothetical protein E3O55_12005 [Cryobacterium sp. MDB1-18-2]|uniref:hypothetical protein n=1 Tax=unclassified Cryobacterium TaxID=2649013 RepID=UPI001068EDE8|nr:MULTISPECIES: hypothetical protein [unclassified Cryobacterium]TFC27543.1 hypothetical protein E3O55_12005 [Cryobacterium sp. MDB1-18-2]TFC37965.1 hypothetical protein E3O50_17455 [Cryobacterium sp. MDB1-18-1]
MLILEAPDAEGILLIGSGAGGDPRRYSTVLDSLAAIGFTVLAPKNERFDPRTVTTEQLLDRAHGLAAALSKYARTDLPVVAAGRSVCGWAALCLAGAHPLDRDGKPLQVDAEERVTRLVLLAPTVGRFQAPGALVDVTVPTDVFVGAKDSITPASMVEILQSAPAMVSIHTEENAGHFDFMTDLPPGMTPTRGLDHAMFLRELASQIAVAIHQ